MYILSQSHKHIKQAIYIRHCYHRTYDTSTTSTATE